MPEPLLAVRNLVTSFRTDAGTVRAVDGVSFDVPKGESVGIVGESGSGKSVTSLSIMRLVAAPAGRIESGQILYAGQDGLEIVALSDEQQQRPRVPQSIGDVQHEGHIVDAPERTGIQDDETILRDAPLGTKAIVPRKRQDVPWIDPVWQNLDGLSLNPFLC